MTVPSATWRQQHSGNGSTFEFSTGFPFLADDEVRVIHTDADGNDTEWTLDTHYTLSGAHTSAPGTVTVILTPTDYTPQTDETLTILSNKELVQPLDAGALTTLPASSVIDALDGAWIAINQLNERVGRAVLASETGSGEGEITSWTPTLAVVEDGDRRVVEITGWTGGTGDEPDGGYLGDAGPEALIGDGTDIRGDQGAPGINGAGAGDMIAAQNLNDVASKPTSFANIKQAATTTATGVLEIATDAEAIAKSDTGRALVPSNLAAIGASTTFAGLVELATSGESVTGTDTARASTPAGVAAAIAALAQNFPAGTAMFFCQTTAPTGWTKYTGSTDQLIRLTNSTVSQGGSVSFSTFSGTTAAYGASTTTVTGTITGTIDSGSSYTGAGLTGGAELALKGDAVSGTFSGSGAGAASVALSQAITYIDTILATKN